MTSTGPPLSCRGDTGLSIKAIREYERLGLIYSVGRSEGDYRMFDASALWCAGVIADCGRWA